MRVLASAPAGRSVNEPDNEDRFPSAIAAKKGLGRYPLLRPGDAAAEYHHLWNWALRGAYEGWRERGARLLLGPGATHRIFDGTLDAASTISSVLARHPSMAHVPADRSVHEKVFVKSIHAELAIEWIAANFDVDVLVLLRHPANVLSSWIDVQLKDSRNPTLETRPDIRDEFVDRWGVPLPGPDPVEQMSWRICLLAAALEEAVARNPGWTTMTHESLCDGPIERFRALFDELGLAWSEATEQVLRDSDQPGEGFVSLRIASEVADTWQRRLDDPQVATLRRVLGTFPISRWTDADFERSRHRDGPG
jgi:hypothetical protein